MMRRREYCTKAEAANFLGLKKGVLNDLRDLDCGPSYIWIGKTLFYRKRDVLRWGASKFIWIH